MINYGDDYWGHNQGARSKLLEMLWGKVQVHSICTAIGELHAPAPTRNAVIGRAHRMGLKRLRKPTHVGPMSRVPLVRNAP